MNSNIFLKLKQLYEISQAEFMKYNGVSPSVGSARELDLIAFLMWRFSDDDIRVASLKEEKADVYINGSPFSIKHKSSLGNSGIKHIWTAETQTVNKFIKNFKQFDTGLIVVLFGTTTSLYNMVPISIMNDVLKQFRTNKKDVFKLLKGNNRGIEYHFDFMREILKRGATVDMGFVLNKRPPHNKAIEGRLEILNG